MQRGPHASTLVMKRIDLLGSLLARSPCPFSLRPILSFPPGAQVLARGRGRARLSPTALRTQWAEEGRALRGSPRGSPTAAVRVAAPPRAAALRRPLEPGVHAHGDAGGPRGGRAYLVTEVLGYFPRSHCAAGRQVGWRYGMLRHSIPALCQSILENSQGASQMS